ncbi:penicillin acylase family protein [Nocardioides sp.]|uniref:penicillin acylase family protein n=1 Tax=Nocardioides sp. TaxID=35761 RepID=UPI0035151943
MRRLLPLLLLAPLLSALPGSPGQAAPAPPPARAARYEAQIRWTEHGIPHITADDFGSLGFGSGYAAAENSICTLLDTLITGRGERSRWFGPSARYRDQVTLDATNLQVDTVVGDLHNRRVVEKLLRSPAGPRPVTKRMVAGYTAGLNAWLARNEVTDPACAGEPWLKQKATPVDLWYGVYLANLLASTGVFVPQIADADPPSLDDPGLPEVPVSAADVDVDALLTALGRDPEAPFGSNATAAGRAITSTGRGMLLGNPHFPWRGRYHFTQQHLTIPGEYDVAGASLIGSPAVNIGWNKDVAWSHTVSTAYRFTPYEYRALGPTTYLTDGGPAQLERRLVKVRVRTPGGGLRTVTEDVYRTPQGYVVDSPATLMPWSLTSVWAIRDANAEHLRTVDTFLEMGRATSVRDLLRRQDAMGGMPWVNTTAADRAGRVLYADHSVVPHVTNEMKQQCLTPVGLLLDQLVGLPGLDGTFAGSRCAWGADADAQRPGILGPRRLPEAFRDDWVMNANDSYWLPNPAERLEGFPTIIGCERCERTMRTRMVSQYVIDRIRGGRKETPRSFRGHQYENRLRAAEVAREGGALDRLCARTGEDEACRVLARWDGRSDADSVGTHLFEAFIAAAPADALWKVPFDPARPLATPRTLNEDSPQLVAAMQAAIDGLRAAKVPLDAAWGDLQVAGDRGADPLPLGGGTGDAVGNANALASRFPVQNRDRYRPITYGSSHIQAISFLDGGRLDARTILTYSQSENPRSPFSQDQTELFSAERWVRFAWTDAQIEADLLRSEVVRG